MLYKRVFGLIVRPSSFLKTFSRLWPAALLIPFRFLFVGKRAFFFRHPFSKFSGDIKFEIFSEVGAYVYINAGKNGVQIGRYSQINALTAIVGNVSIGERVLIAPNCSIVSSGHRFGKGVQPRFSGAECKEKIVIEDDVWIGAGVTLVGNIKVGRGSVVAAGLVVDCDIPDETLVRRGSASLLFEPLR